MSTEDMAIIAALVRRIIREELERRFGPLPSPSGETRTGDLK